MSESLSQGDIKLFQEAPEWADVKLDINDSSKLVLDDGIENYVLISLFTNARASDNDVLPDELTDKQGFWGDVLNEFSIGSKLWLLQRERIGNRLLTLAKQYAEESLQWMIDDGIIDSVAIKVSRDPVEKNRIVFSGEIIKIDKGKLGFAYFYNWANQVAKEVL